MKLTVADAATIRFLAKRGTPAAGLARQYHVTPATIYYVLQRKTFKQSLRQMLLKDRAENFKTGAADE